MSDKKIGDFFVQEPGIGGKPTDWNEVMVTPPGHPMLRNDLDKHADEDVEIFRRAMQTLQESMGVPVGGYPKDQMAVVIGVDTPRIPVSEMDRLLLIESDQKPGWFRKRAPIITDEMLKVLENPDGRRIMLMNARTVGKTQVNKAWLEIEQWALEIAAIKKSRIRYALRCKTKKGPKRKTYPL